MSLVYFENHDWRTIAIAADKIIALTAKRLPTETPVLITCVDGVLFDVRGDMGTAQQKLLAAQKEQI